MLRSKLSSIIALVLAAGCGEVTGNPLVTLDATSGVDAANAQDAGGFADAMEISDAMLDAGSVSDSGAPMDAAPGTDAAPASDAAPGPDATAADAAEPADSGTPTSDGGAAPGLPRLVVSSANGLSWWDGAGQLHADRAPDVAMPFQSPPLAIGALAVDGDRLFFGVPGPGYGIGVVDQARSLRAPASRLVAAAGLRVTGLGAGQGHLFAMSESNPCDPLACVGLRIFDGSQSLAPGSAPRANLFHPWGQMPTFAWDSGSERVFAGQISGAGLIAWNATATRSGDLANDFQVDPGAYWGLAIDGGRLFATGDRSGSHSSGLAIWDDVAHLTGPMAPAVILSSGFPARQTFLPSVTVRHDQMAVAVRDEGQVFIYTQVAGIHADRAPDRIITDPAMTRPRKALFDVQGRLYVLDDDGVLIFDNGLAGWSLAAKIVSGISMPADIALVE